MGLMKYELLKKRKDVSQRGRKKERVRGKAGPNQAALLGRFAHVEKDAITKRGSQSFRGSARLTTVPACQV